MSSYSEIRKRNKSPLSVKTDNKFYQELSQKLWESKPTDENQLVDVPLMKTKRTQQYLNNDENEMIAENRRLKQIIIQLKLDMKSKLEQDLLKQKNEFQGILQEYVEFIDKILQDKKELQQQLDLLRVSNSYDQSSEQQLKQQLTMLQEENQKSLQQSDEFNDKLQQIEELLQSLEHDKQNAHEKINQLKQQNQQLKIHYEEKIQAIKAQNYQDFQKFEQIVQSALDKKDAKINKLKQQLQ
ncbi:hypothetical protein pb186bvf_019588 [Paramecium bursaria]